MFKIEHKRRSALGLQGIAPRSHSFIAGLTLRSRRNEISFANGEAAIHTFVVYRRGRI
jgi:hypothetical protein